MSLNLPQHSLQPVRVSGWFSAMQIWGRCKSCWWTCSNCTSPCSEASSPQRCRLHQCWCHTLLRQVPCGAPRPRKARRRAVLQPPVLPPRLPHQRRKRLLDQLAPAALPRRRPRPVHPAAGHARASVPQSASKPRCRPATQHRQGSAPCVTTTCRPAPTSWNHTLARATVQVAGHIYTHPHSQTHTCTHTHAHAHTHSQTNTATHTPPFHTHTRHYLPTQ